MIARKDERVEEGKEGEQIWERRERKDKGKGQERIEKDPEKRTR